MGEASPEGVADNPMSAKTAHQEFTPYDGSHESDTEYSQSIEDFTVPEPVAELTGIGDLSEYNGFEHRGEQFMASVVVSNVRQALYFEHSHSGDDPTPQAAITPHAAIDRTVSQLSSLFESWFEADPDGFDRETSGHSADADQLYSALLLDDPLQLRSQSVDVPYAREAHRQIIVSAISFLLATVTPHADADATTRQQSAEHALRKAIAFDVADDLSREDAIEIVNATYDQLESSSD
jgi:hypothetical protein